MNRRYAVIGSNCFTGSHIVSALLDDPSATVVGTSRSPEYDDLFLPYASSPRRDAFQFHQIDSFREFERLIALLDSFQPDVVINVAALSEVALSNSRPNEYFQINTLAVVNLCNELRQREYLRRYVHISSAEIFGSCVQPATEETLFNPSTPYAVSKAAADMYLATLRRNFDFPAIIIRSTNVYGRHQQLFKIIPRTAIYLKLGRPIELHGGGTAMKSFIHIRDVVRGLQLAIDHSANGTYHFSVPSDAMVADVVRLVCHQMGHDFNRVVRMTGERLGQDSRYTLDCSKAHRDLGWQSQIHFTDGVREVIDWIESRWDDIRRKPLEYIHKV